MNNDLTLCARCGSEKEPRKLCKNCKRLYDKQRYKRMSKKILAHQKFYDKTHKDDRIQYHKEWYKKNKEKVLEKNRINKKIKYDTDISFRLKSICASSIYQAMKSSKNGSLILDYLPYTMLELKFHLENQFDDKMSWENYGSYWQIDHIIPQSKLPYTSMTDDNFKLCWALGNLRPLEASENRKKFNKCV